MGIVEKRREGCSKKSHKGALAAWSGDFFKGKPKNFLKRGIKKNFLKRGIKIPSTPLAV